MSGSPFDESPASTIQRLWPLATRKKSELDSLLETFTLGKDKSIAVQQRLGALTNEFSRLVNQIESDFARVKGEFEKREREVWTRRIGKLTDEAVSFRSSLDKQLGHTYRKQLEEEQRKKLFGDSSQRETIQSYAREREAIHEAHGVIDEIASQGRQIIRSITSQNRVLKGARRRMLDVASSIGLSSSLLTVAGRRHATDRWLVYSCMVITIIVFILLWRFKVYG